MVCRFSSTKPIWLSKEVLKRSTAFSHCCLQIRMQMRCDQTIITTTWSKINILVRINVRFNIRYRVFLAYFVHFHGIFFSRKSLVTFSSEISQKSLSDRQINNHLQFILNALEAIKNRVKSTLFVTSCNAIQLISFYQPAKYRILLSIDNSI